MIRMSQVSLGMDEPIEKLKTKVARTLGIAESDIGHFRIFRESFDGRKGKMRFVYTVDFTAREGKKLPRKHKQLSKSPDYTYQPPNYGSQNLTGRPVVIGAGPAGLFAALLLAQEGYRPILLDRGQAVAERTQSVDAFWQGGPLNPESNVQFGEGGAGAFSDGKLTTRIKDPRCRKVLEELVAAGAPEEIMYMNKPHVGTDLLKPTVVTIREKIISLGGDVRFNTRVDRINRDDQGGVKSVTLGDGTLLETGALVLAIGHSARDTFEMLHDQDIAIAAKPFAVGVRIEHPQVMIDQVQYKTDERPDRLGAAEYQVTYQTADDRGVYTFCMCPGGMVVASSSEIGGVVTNGMSEHARDQVNANSAVLVSVQPKDFDNAHPLAGMYFQRDLEQKAYQAGGENYQAPAQLLVDFLAGQTTTQAGDISPSYQPGISWCNLRDILPNFIGDALAEGLVGMGRKLKGFDRPDAVLTGIETRTSSPIRILRDQETLESTNSPGLYPCGEGAGYAGGIMSSAVDGLKCAEMLIGKYAKPTD